METAIEMHPSPVVFVGLERRALNEWIKELIKSADTYSEDKLKDAICRIESEDLDGRYWLTVRTLKQFLKLKEDNKLVWNIKIAVCDEMNVNVDLIETKTRKKEIVQARQIIQFIVKYQTKWSLEKVGLFVGSKNHATIMHSLRTVRNLYETDKFYRKNVDKILKILDAEKIKKWLV